MRDTVEWAIRRSGVTLPTPVFGIPLIKDAAARATVPREKLSATATNLTVLTALAVCYTLFVARSVVLPIVIAVLFSFLLRGPVRSLRRLGVPEGLGAAIVVIGGVLLIGGSVYLLSAPASSWVARAPEAIAETERKVRNLSNAIGRLEATAAKAERIAAGAGGSGATPRTTVVTPAPTPLIRRVFGTVANFMVSTLSVILLTYFLLASGDLFMRKTLKVLPNDLERDGLPQKISDDVETAIGLYLRTTVLINIGLGVATWALLLALGMPNAGLWGTVAGLLNFVPYIGALLTTGILAIASVTIFDTLSQAMLVPGAFLVLNMIESNIVTPLLMGTQFPLNTVAIFVGVLFWSFIWGVAGAILAVPIMVTLKILCDAIPALAPMGEFLGP